MGQEGSSLSVATQFYQLPQYEYALKKRINASLAIWQNKNSPFDELLEHRMIVNTQQELKAIFEGFKMRHQHHFLPSTRYLSHEQFGIKGCGQYYRGSLYLETKVTSLSKINDIPFQDTLHMYQVAFKGFEILYKRFGYFDIFEDMFHICDHGKLKVWCNSEVYKLTPEEYLRDQSGRQEDMIYRIIHIIDENSDHADRNSFKRKLQEKMAAGFVYVTFDDINQIFRLICRENGWQPPQRLKCLQNFCKEDIDRIMKQHVHSLESIGGHLQQNQDYGIDYNRQNQDKNMATLRKNQFQNPFAHKNNEIPTQKRVEIHSRNRLENSPRESQQKIRNNGSIHKKVQNISSNHNQNQMDRHFNFHIRNEGNARVSFTPQRKRNQISYVQPFLSPSAHFRQPPLNYQNHTHQNQNNYRPSYPPAPPIPRNNPPYPADTHKQNFIHQQSNQKTFFQENSFANHNRKTPQFSPNSHQQSKSSIPQLFFSRPPQYHIPNSPKKHQNILNPFPNSRAQNSSANNVGLVHSSASNVPVFQSNRQPQTFYRHTHQPNVRFDVASKDVTNHRENSIRYRQAVVARNSPHKLLLQQVSSERFLFPEHSGREKQKNIAESLFQDKKSQLNCSNIIERSKNNQDFLVTSVEKNLRPDSIKSVQKKQKDHGWSFTFNKEKKYSDISIKKDDIREFPSQHETEWNPKSSLKIRDRKDYNQYTDPKLFQILSSNHSYKMDNMTTKPQTSKEQEIMKNRQNQSEKKEPMNFSFHNLKPSLEISNSKVDDSRDWKNMSRKREQMLEISRNLEGLSRRSSKQREYAPVMDQDIWKDLQFLKRNKQNQYQI